MKNLILILTLTIATISLFSCEKDEIIAPLENGSYQGIFIYNSDTSEAICEFVADNSRALYGVIIKTPQGNSLYWESFSDVSVVSQTPNSLTFSSLTQDATFETND
tara:strand:- start:2300 stop:2617 length:318 start_codon:yes stop_codon:yes gene_type:complete